MKYKRRVYQDSDFIKIRDFLKLSYKSFYYQHNWLIDRWNFCRYFAQSMHRTFHNWPETVGLWIGDDDNVIAVVNSEGENRGEAFFQLGNIKFSNDFLNEMINYAEKKLSTKKDNERFINLRVNENSHYLKEMLRNRNYELQEWKEPTSSLDLIGNFKVNLSNGFRIVDANEVDNYQKGLAHAKAFGYYNPNDHEDDDAERAYESLRKAPDYKAEFDLSIVDKNSEIASFATIWYDKLNKVGILEPVGTIQKYRKMGLGKAVIYEGINRIKSYGARKIYVGSDQKFYLSKGFSVEYSKEIWQKKW